MPQKDRVSLSKASRSSREHGYVGVDMLDTEDKTVSTDHDDTATVWPQAGNDAKEGAPMRARRQRGSRSDYLTDALTLLQGWTQDGVQLRRVHTSAEAIRGSGRAA